MQPNNKNLHALMQNTGPTQPSILQYKAVLPTSPSCVDVQLGQRQGEGQLSSLGVGGTLQDVMQGVSPSCPARGDEVCICCLNIRHRSCIVHTATPMRRASASLSTHH